MIDVYVSNVDECKLEVDEMIYVLLVFEDNDSNKSDNNVIFVEEIGPTVLSEDGTGDVINVSKDVISLN